MKIATSFGLLLAAAVVGGPQLALADPPPLTQVLQDFQDTGKAMERLERERAEAEAARTKAQAELDDLKRQNPQAGDEAEKIQKRIDEADATIRRIDLIVEGDASNRQLEFKATNEEEVKLALHLPEILQKIIDALGSHRINDKFTAEPYFDPSNNAGGIKLHWKGNP